MSIESEKQIIQKMIQLFCKMKHGTDTLCDECTPLLDYARDRLDHCPFSDDKPVCRQCTAHCYSPAMRKKISEVMRFSAPRMIWRHPLLTLHHLHRVRCQNR